MSIAELEAPGVEDRWTRNAVGRAVELGLVPLPPSMPLDASLELFAAFASWPPLLPIEPVEPALMS